MKETEKNRTSRRFCECAAKIVLSVLLTSVAFVSFASCKMKEETKRTGTEQEIPSVPEKGLKTGAISGLLYDMDSEDTPIPGAKVILKVDADGDGSFSGSNETFVTKTEEDGSFSFTGVPISKDGRPMRVIIRFEKENFGTNTKILEATGDAVITSRMRGQLSSDMTRKNNMVTGRFVTGRIVTGRAVRIRGVQEGKTVVELGIPESAIPNSAQQITGYVTYLNPALEPELFPGDFLARNPKSQNRSPIARILRIITKQQEEPQEVRLESAGLAEVVLKDEAGNRIPVKGKSVLKMLVPKDTWMTIKDSDPKTSDRIEVPLWHFNEQVGIWEQYEEFGWLVDSDEKPIPASELNKIRSGQYQGDIYSYGEVPHFSWWNVDWPIIYHTCVCGKISAEDRDGNAQPVKNTFVTMRGKTYSGSTNVQTNNFGVFCGNVKRSETGDETYDSWTYSETHKFLEKQPSQNTGGQERIEIIVNLGASKLRNIKGRTQKGEEVDWSDVGTPSLQGTAPGTEDNPCRWIGEFVIRTNREVKGTVLEDRGSGKLAPLADIPVASSTGQVGRTDKDGNFRILVPQNVKLRVFSSGLFSKAIDAGESPVELGQIIVRTDRDGDGYTKFEDCDDLNNAVNPKAQEKCDGIDNNCNGVVDEGFGVGQICVVGLGRCQQNGLTVCNAQGTGTVCNATPLQPEPEACNKVDDNCNGTVDEGDVCKESSGGGGTQVCPDNDGDGFTASYCGGTDCNDNSAAINPNSPETCNNTDDNCNGVVDEGDVCQPTTACPDDNNDGIPDIHRATIKTVTPQKGYIVQAGEVLRLSAELEFIAKEKSDYKIAVVSQTQMCSHYTKVLTSIPLSVTQPGCYTKSYSFQISVPADSSAIVLEIREALSDYPDEYPEERFHTMTLDRVMYPVDGTDWIMIISTSPSRSTEIEVDSLSKKDITVNVSYSSIHQQSNILVLISGIREGITYFTSAMSYNNAEGARSATFNIPVTINECIDILSVRAEMFPYEMCPNFYCDPYDSVELFLKYRRPFLYADLTCYSSRCLYFYSSDTCAQCLVGTYSVIPIPIVFNPEDWPNKVTDSVSITIHSCQSLSSDFNLTDNITGQKWLSYTPPSGNTFPTKVLITADITKVSSQTTHNAIAQINSRSALNAPLTVPVSLYFVDMDITQLPYQMEMGKQHTIGFEIGFETGAPEYSFACLSLVYSDVSSNPTTYSSPEAFQKDWGTYRLGCFGSGSYSVQLMLPYDSRMCDKLNNFSLKLERNVPDCGNEFIFSEVVTSFVNMPAQNVLRTTPEYSIYMNVEGSDPVTRTMKVEEVCNRPGSFNIVKTECRFYNPSQGNYVPTNCDWISVSPDSGNLPRNVIITVNPAGLQKTYYYATLSVESPGAESKMMYVYVRVN